MKIYWQAKFSLLLVVMAVGCVTQTDRMPYHRYYDPPEDESVMDELRREFGWQKPPPWGHEEPLYKQAARGVKETVTGWFKRDDSASALPGGLQTMQELQRAQNEAMQRMQQQKTGDGSPADEPSGMPNGLFAPDVGGATTEK